MEHHDIFRFKTAGEWYMAARAEGYRIPGILVHYLEKYMKKTGCSFPVAYNRFREAGVIMEDYLLSSPPYNLGKGVMFSETALERIEELKE